MTRSGVDEARRALELVDAAWAERDIPAIVAHLSAAVRGFTSAGDSRAAAMACVRLGDVYSNLMGNCAAGRAWFVRARRLVGDEPPCVEQGWAAIAEMGCEVPDPDELLAGSELALERARRFGDVNLETKALADGGLARVQNGRFAEGMAMLDEAMALACGPADDAGTAAKSVCSFFTACYVSGDFERAGVWTDLIATRGLLDQGTPNGAFLAGHCDSVRAALLVEMGQWTEAEAVLVAAKQLFEATMQVTSSWHPDIALADLRTRQGRYTDAEALLVGKDQRPDALLPQARLHLARGDHELARAAARRGLRSMGDDRMRATELMLVLIDAELAAGDVQAASAACALLVERSRSLDLPTLRARCAGAHARAVAANGDLQGAISVLDGIVHEVDPVRLAWIHATLLIELAQLRERAGDIAGARLDAAAAVAALQQLDVTVPVEAAQLLDRLTGRRQVPAPSAAATLARDGKWWTATCDGVRVRMQDSKGLAYLADLIAHPGCERHALDLVDRVEGIDPEGIDRRALGDAGELLDATARTAYRHRIETLRAEVDEALAAGMLERAEEIETELDRLVAQLAAAFGLGGRTRRSSSASEKARLNVTRAVRAAIARITGALPAAGSALDRHVRTGLYCSYEPAAGELVWIVQS